MYILKSNFLYVWISKGHERSELAQAKSEANKRQLIRPVTFYTSLFCGNIYSHSTLY
jgi:hypothetical protein